MSENSNSNSDTLAVGLMAKSPEVGKVKTRLAMTIGDQQALALYQELLKRVHREFVLSNNDSDLQIAPYWFVEPKSAIDQIAEAYPGFEKYLPQSSGDLGQRMQAAMTQLLTNHSAATLIGADIPDLTKAHLQTVCEALKTNDAVFGPTVDGGYYLISMKQMHPELFADITWSAANTLKESLTACQRNNISYTLLPELHDIDSIEDLPKVTWRPDQESLQKLF